MKPESEAMLIAESRGAVMVGGPVPPWEGIGAGSIPGAGYEDKRGFGLGRYDGVRAMYLFGSPKEASSQFVAYIGGHPSSADA